MVEEKKEEIKQPETKEPIKPVKKEDPNKGNKIVLIIIFVTMITIAIVGYLEKDEVIKLYNQIQGKEQDIPYDDYYDDDSEEVKPSEPETKNDNLNSNELKVYLYEYNGKYNLCKTDYSKCTYITTIKTESNVNEVIRNYENSYILYSDNYILKVYSVDDNKIYTTTLKRSDFNGGYIIVNDKTNKLLGLIYTKKSDYYQFYSFEKNKVMYENTYKYLDYVNDKYLSGTIENGYKFVKADLLDINEEKIIMSEDKSTINNENGAPLYFISNNKYYILAATVGDHEECRKVYNENLEVILSFDSHEIMLDSEISFTKNNQIYIVNDSLLNNYDFHGNRIKKNFVNVYDNNGKYVKKSIEYDEVYTLIDEYIIASKNNNLIITTIDEEDIIIRSWSNYNLYYNPYHKAYKDNDNIIIEVEDDSVSVDEVWEEYKDSEYKYFDSKEDLRNIIDSGYYASAYRIGYSYTYNTNTKEIKKKPAIISYMY